MAEAFNEMEPVKSSEASHPDNTSVIVSCGREGTDHILMARPLCGEPIEAIVSVFERIAQEEGWQHHGELHAHIASSTYLGIWFGANDVESSLIGGVQLVGPDSVTGTLPCHSVWPELSCPVAKGIAHVAILAVNREWRGKRAAGESHLPAAFWTLCAALWRHCLKSGITELWLEATPTMLRCYRLLGWPLVVQGELRTHWGEYCYPCKLSLREVAGSLAEKATRSALYRDIFLIALAPSQIK